MAESTLRETLEEALEDAETSSALGDDYKAYLQLQKAIARVLESLTELERDHEAMEKVRVDLGEGPYTYETDDEGMDGLLGLFSWGDVGHGIPSFSDPADAILGTQEQT